MIRVLLVFCVVAALLSACRDSGKTEPRQKVVTTKAANKSSAKRKARRRLPAPLRPKATTKPGYFDVDEQPCDVLVNKLCALLSEGSEECNEARTEIRRRADSIDQSRCTSALAWYRRRIEDAKRSDPCGVLAKVTCATHGLDSMSCANARADLPQMNTPQVRTMLLRACRAELLFIKGLGR